MFFSINSNTFQQMATKHIPFDKETGSLMTYVSPWQIREDKVEWRDNKPFVGTMKICGFMRGRSAARLRLEVEDKPQCNHEMFTSDMLQMLQEAKIDKGVVSGLWKFRKHGANYGMCWLGGEEGAP